VITLSLIDVVLIVLYFAAVLFVGFRAARRTTNNEEDYLLAGRSLTLPIFVMTLVSTWYGGILGVGEFSYRYGISNWIVQGIPYYVFAAVFAVFLAKRIRESNLVTIPDKLESSYDQKTALLGSFLTFVLMTPAPYVLMLSVFLQMLFGWSVVVSLIVTAVVAVSYLFVGGMRADIHTDVLEFVLMFAGFAVILPFCFSNFGGLDFLTTHLPAMHLQWHGGNSIQFILVWFFIALWTLVDPAFHQRCYAAKDGPTAQKGIFISIVFWFMFDFMTATAGLYARAALPSIPNPVMAYPMLAEAILPPIAKGLFYIGMLATMMSTLNTLAFVSAQTLGRDVVGRMKRFGSRNARSENPEPVGIVTAETHTGTRYSTTLWTQLGLLVSFAFSIIIALAFPSVIQIWYTIGTVIVPGLLVPIVASYFEKLKIEANYAFAAMLTGWLTSTAWLMTGIREGMGGSYLLGTEPMYPGLVVSLAIWEIGRLRKQRAQV
jgi:SSS family solute:Na+ symporter